MSIKDPRLIKAINKRSRTSAESPWAVDGGSAPPSPSPTSHLGRGLGREDGRDVEEAAAAVARLLGAGRRFAARLHRVPLRRGSVHLAPRVDPQLSWPWLKEDYAARMSRGKSLE
jgi:hypothetical protein